MIIGIDEVGRGCWAGPLVAAAVGLEEAHGIVGLDDSKKLSALKRRRLVAEIRLTTTAIGIGWVWPAEINTMGLTKSVQLAMQRAIDQIALVDQQIIIDGHINYLAHIPNTTPIVKADGTIPAVSAASIIAKVARDLYMQQIAAKYHHYGFEKHVGYGTKVHRDALARYGITPIHRINYKPIRKLLGTS